MIGSSSNRLGTELQLAGATAGLTATSAPLAMPVDSVSDSSFGIADHNDGSDPTLFDYHSSNATFGSLKDSY